jgi:predicted Zn-dependent protease
LPEKRSFKPIANDIVMLTSMVLLLCPAKTFASDDLDNRQAANTLLHRGVELIKAGDIESAVPILKQSVQLDDSSAAAHNDLGYCLNRLGQRAEARSELEKATAVNPKMADPWATLGQIEVETGDLQGALRAYQNYLNLAEDSPRRHNVEQAMNSIRQQINLGAASGGRDYFHAVTEQNGVLIWRQMPVTVFVERGDGVPGFKPEYDTKLRQAFSDWSQLSGGRISFVFAPRENKADIVCRWTDNRANLKSSIEGGECNWKARTTGELVHADIILLTVDPAPDVHLTDDMMEWIIHHEIGHALGIHGHSADPDDVMYFSGTPYAVSKRFTHRDQNTLARLYGF